MLVRLDAKGLSTPLGFLGALHFAIGAPDWQGYSFAAFIDTIFWDDCNRLKPPYRIVVVGTEDCPVEVVNYIGLMSKVLAKARADRFARTDIDIDVSLFIAPRQPISN